MLSTKTKGIYFDPFYGYVHNIIRIKMSVYITLSNKFLLFLSKVVSKVVVPSKVVQ